MLRYSRSKRRQLVELVPAQNFKPHRSCGFVPSSGSEGKVITTEIVGLVRHSQLELMEGAGMRHITSVCRRSTWSGEIKWPVRLHPMVLAKQHPNRGQGSSHLLMNLQGEAQTSELYPAEVSFHLPPIRTN